MLSVFRSNRAEQLAALLALQLLHDPPGPFETVRVVVNTWPTSRWLGEQLALELGGIAANLRFPFLTSELRQTVDGLLGEGAAGSDPWRATELVWPLLELLPALAAGPDAALLARWLLVEALPAGFRFSLVLIGAGLILPQAAMAMGSDLMDDAAGIAWALVGVLAFAGSAISGRTIAARRWPAAVAVGVPTLLSALVFGVIALVLFGPHHFVLLRLWWLVGVIGVYAVTLALGRELALQQAYRRCSVAVVSLWGSLALVVAVLSAALLLWEPLSGPVLACSALVLAGVVVGRRPGPIRSRLSPVSEGRHPRRSPPRS